MPRPAPLTSTALYRRFRLLGLALLVVALVLLAGHDGARAGATGILAGVCFLVAGVCRFDALEHADR